MVGMGQCKENRALSVSFDLDLFFSPNLESYKSTMMKKTCPSNKMP